MNTVKFFHRELPIYGDPEYRDLPDGKFQFWFVACPHDGVLHGYTMRTIKGRPLQERLDEFVRKDSTTHGYDMIWASYVRPATQGEFGGWWKSHQWVYRKAA